MYAVYYMRKTWLFLAILWLGSSGALGQSLWGFGHDRYIERDGFSKNRCEGNNNSSPSSRPSRGIDNLQSGFDLEEYLRDAKLKEKEKAKARQPPPTNSNNKVLLWLAGGSGGALLVVGTILWLIFRIKIAPCPKCQNADKKNLRTGEMCRTPTNFLIKCYCDACGYKWIQKGRRA